MEKLWYYEEKLWYYGQNYGTMDKTMLLYQELWNLIYEGKKHGRLPKTNLKTFI